MNFDLEVYRGEEPAYVGDFPFEHLLRKAAQRRFGESARRGQIELTLEEPHDPIPYPGPPEVRNLAAKLGHCVLRIIHDGQTVREDRLRVAELFGPVLIPELRDIAADEQRWGFMLRQRRIIALLFTQDGVAAGRPAPEAKGSVEVDPGDQRHQPFTLTPIEVADAAQAAPEDLGLDPERLGRLNVLLPARIHDQLVRDMPLSSQLEEGGFLLGRITKWGEDRHLIDVTHVTPAHHSGAGMIHFTFTGESFLTVARLLEERGEEEDLVGWYHTHPSGLGVAMGLSTIDVDLHLATFQRPWQVAALINLRRQGRLLRFYGRGDDGLVPCDMWIGDDSGRYRPAGDPMGSDADD